MTGPKRGTKMPPRPHTAPRGGARKPGKGRPPIYGVSDEERDRLVQALRAQGEASGKDWTTLFCEFLYHTAEEDRRLFLAGAKLLGEWIFTKGAERAVTTATAPVEPAIYLPEEAVDPGKVVPLHTA